MIRRAALTYAVVAVLATGTATAQVVDRDNNTSSVSGGSAPIPSVLDVGAARREPAGATDPATTTVGDRSPRHDSRSQRRRDATALLDRLVVQLKVGRRAVASYERTGRRMRTWFGCIDRVPVDQVGDIEHRWGFQYDEQDGTGLDARPALVLHTGSGRPDLLLLRLARDTGCLSQAPDPNGTGADARVAHPHRAGRPINRMTLRKVERRLRRLDARIDEVESAAERFDEWESCLSWLPVTELGHEDQSLGYLFDAPGRLPDAPQSSRVGAVDIDASEWDDPDYELLAFLGRDRPSSAAECGHEPGEGVDRAVPPPRGADARRVLTTRGGRGRGESLRDRLGDLRRDVAGAIEDIEDLREPVEEFVHFDECMYTVGMRNRGSSTDGYRYVDSAGTVSHRSALSFDLRGLTLPEMDIMAFSGEEPPQIECNEDAGGEGTDE